MIGLHLPRGILVRCIRGPKPTGFVWGGVPLRVGQFYHLRGYQDESIFAAKYPSYYENGPYTVLLEEISAPYPHIPGFEWAYDRQGFCVVQTLPASILECLKARPKRVNKRQREDA